ncbi:Protein translocase membrane subunit SecG [hydrothermal vent metagenome]|uniref:Protein translocase membrane subunit SecG n=1 Tax=hydrothermal vent metagenome TaxID=652676 RepID=A0A3B1BH51_9ZZZZ
MYTIILLIHVTVALALIGIVLLQRGKGATIGAAFGGSSQTLFGPRGPATALAKITTGAAIVFMLTSITLSTIKTNARESSIIEDTGAPALPTALPEEDAPRVPITPSPAVDEGLKDIGPVEDPSAPATEEKPIGPTGG